MPRLCLNSTLDTCRTVLADFEPDSDGHNQNLPDDGRGRYAQYTLNGPQVGAVRLLLWYASEVTYKHRSLKRRLKQTQPLIDASIAHLDPDSTR
jgi:hypothetical protein